MLTSQITRRHVLVHAENVMIEHPTVNPDVTVIGVAINDVRRSTQELTSGKNISIPFFRTLLTNQLYK